MRAIPREVSDGVVKDAVHAYALGAWCADGYWWSSSIGFTNTEPEFIVRFARFLTSVLPPERLRLRIYEVAGSPIDPRVLELTERISVLEPHKMERTAYQVYVNCRPLVRSFFEAKQRLGLIEAKYLGPYFAGRFDGDGTWGSTPRIAYRTEEEATTDHDLMKLMEIESSVLHYAKANEYCVYIHKSGWDSFRDAIHLHSWKSERRLTL